MNRRVVRRYAGMMAMVLLLGGCGSSGGAGQTETPEMTSPEETVVQTEASSEASAVETTEAAATTEETSETSVTEKETTGAAAETTAEESSETAEAAEETTEAATETAAETEAATEAETAAGTEAATEAAAETEATAASLSDIYSQIEQQVSLNSPMTVPEDFIANYFGIDVSSAEDYLFVMSEMATSAETIVIVKAGGADKQALADSLQTVINQKAAEMENYLPDQYDIVSRSTVHQTGDYVWMVISENAGAIEPIIEAGLQ